MAKHYVIVDEFNRITHGFSDEFEQPTKSAICVNEDGYRHFEINGVVNPPLLLTNGVHLYKLDGLNIVLRSKEELEADINSIICPPTIEERISVIEIAVKELSATGVVTAELESAIAEIETVLNG